MSSDSKSSPSNSSSSERDDRNIDSDPKSEPEPEAEPETETEVEEELEAEGNKNPDLIDQSLDALENQLASISMSSRSPTATVEDGEREEVGEEVDEVESREHPATVNGSLSGEIGAGGDADFVEDRHLESNSKAEPSGVNEENGSFVWRNAPELDEVERPLSPGSSGYAGEMGSTSGGDEIIDDDEDGSETRGVDVENDGVSGSHSQWVSGKRHADEVSRNSSSFLHLIIIINMEFVV